MRRIFWKYQKKEEEEEAVLWTNAIVLILLFGKAHFYMLSFFHMCLCPHTFVMASLCIHRYISAYLTKKNPLLHPWPLCWFVYVFLFYFKMDTCGVLRAVSAAHRGQTTGSEVRNYSGIQWTGESRPVLLLSYHVCCLPKSNCLP